LEGEIQPFQFRLADIGCRLLELFLEGRKTFFDGTVDGILVAAKLAGDLPVGVTLVGKVQGFDLFIPGAHVALV
jgi:hypothetical protein